MKHKFKYEWYLKEGYPAEGINYHGKKVFSCFACGGGSTMGYKLAGYDVIGFNEFDPKKAESYILNHNPKFSFIEAIQTFKDRDDLPEELYNLDILDGSPPCSSFSIAGVREKYWGKEKTYGENNIVQVFDTLFFDFIDLAKKLQPKVVVAENVKGLLLGNARQYLTKILKEFDKAGYDIQYKLLDSSKMGVPQKRERVFFYGLRKDLSKPFLKQNGLFEKKPFLNLEFNEPTILFSDIFTDYTDRPLSKKMLEIWNLRKFGDTDFSNINEREFKKPNLNFNHKFIYMNDSTINTITASDQCVLFDYPRYRNFHELSKSSSYPMDYNFGKNNKVIMIGRAVPPVMMAQLSNRIYEGWLSKI